jgi:hypothetical protein
MKRKQIELNVAMLAVKNLLTHWLSKKMLPHCFLIFLADAKTAA